MSTRRRRRRKRRGKLRHALRATPTVMSVEIRRRKTTLSRVTLAVMLVKIRRRKRSGKLRHEVVRVSMIDWSTGKKPKFKRLPLTHLEVAAALSVFFIFSSGLFRVYLTMPSIDYSKLKTNPTIADLRLLKQREKEDTGNFGRN